MLQEWNKTPANPIEGELGFSDFTVETLHDIVPEIQAKEKAINNLFNKIITTDKNDPISIKCFIDVGLNSVHEENLADVVSACKQVIVPNPSQSELRRLKNELTRLYINQYSNKKNINNGVGLIRQITTKVQEIINRVCDNRSLTLGNTLANTFAKEAIEEKVLESQKQRGLAVDLLQLRKSYIDAEMYTYMGMSCEDLLETQVRVERFGNADVRYQSVREILEANDTMLDSDANTSKALTNNQRMLAVRNFIAETEKTQTENAYRIDDVLSMVEAYQRTDMLINDYDMLQSIPIVFDDKGMISVNNDIPIRSGIENINSQFGNNKIENALQAYIKNKPIEQKDVDELYTTLLNQQESSLAIKKIKPRFVEKLIGELTDQVMFNVNFDGIKFKFSDAYTEDLPFTLEIIEPKNEQTPKTYTCRYVRLAGGRRYLELVHESGTGLYFYDEKNKLRRKQGGTNLQEDILLPIFLCGKKDKINMYNNFTGGYIQGITFTNNSNNYQFAENSYHVGDGPEVLNSTLAQIDAQDRVIPPSIPGEEAPEFKEELEELDETIKLTASEYLLDVIRALKGGFRLTKDPLEGITFTEFDTGAGTLGLGDLYTYLDEFPELMIEHVLQIVVQRFQDRRGGVSDYITSHPDEYKRNIRLMLSNVTGKAKGLIQATKIESEVLIPKVTTRLKLASVLEEYQANILINNEIPSRENIAIIEKIYSTCIEKFLGIKSGSSLTIDERVENINIPDNVNDFLTLLNTHFIQEAKTNKPPNFSFGGEKVQCDGIDGENRVMSTTKKVSNDSINKLFKAINDTSTDNFNRDKPKIEQRQTYYLMDKSADMLFHGFMEACAPTVTGLPSSYSSGGENLLNKVTRTASLSDKHPGLKALTDAIGTGNGDLDIYSTDMIAGTAKTIVFEAAMLYASGGILNVVNKSLAASRYVRLAKVAFHRATRSSSLGGLARIGGPAWNAIRPWGQTAANYAFNTITQGAGFHAIHASLLNATGQIDDEELTEQLTSQGYYIHSMLIMSLLGISPTIARAGEKIAYSKSTTQALDNLKNTVSLTNQKITSGTFWSTLNTTGVQFPLEVAGMYGIEHYIFPPDYLTALQNLYPYADKNTTEQLAVIQQLVGPLLLVSILKGMHNLPMGKRVTFQEINILNSKQGVDSKTVFTIDKTAYKYENGKLYSKDLNSINNNTVERKLNEPKKNVDLFSPEQQLAGYLRNLQSHNLRLVSENMNSADNSKAFESLLSKQRPARDKLSPVAKEEILETGKEIHANHNKVAKDSNNKTIWINKELGIPKLANGMLLQKRRILSNMLEKHGCPKEIQSSIFSSGVRDGIFNLDVIRGIITNQEIANLSFYSNFTVGDVIDLFRNDINFNQTPDLILKDIFYLLVTTEPKISTNGLVGEGKVTNANDLVKYLKKQDKSLLNEGFQTEQVNGLKNIRKFYECLKEQFKKYIAKEPLPARQTVDPKKEIDIYTREPDINRGLNGMNKARMTQIAQQAIANGASENGIFQAILKEINKKQNDKKYRITEDEARKQFETYDMVGPMNHAGKHAIQQCINNHVPILTMQEYYNAAYDFFQLVKGMNLVGQERLPGRGETKEFTQGNIKYVIEMRSVKGQECYKISSTGQPPTNILYPNPGGFFKMNPEGELNIIDYWMFPE